jgi:hypothetical protein
MTDFPAYDWLSDIQAALEAQESWDKGIYDQRVTAHLAQPDLGPFGIASGASLLADHVRRFRFTPEVIQRMGRMSDRHGRAIFHESFLNYVQRLRLRVQVSGAPAGALLLPGEPLLLIQGPRAQVQLLDSAFRKLSWESSCWTTLAAQQRWQLQDWEEAESPAPAGNLHSEQGWKSRALFIGGADPNDPVWQSAPIPAYPGLQLLQNEQGEALQQVRRLFNGSVPLGDVWLSARQEEKAAVGQPIIRCKDQQGAQEIRFTRFQQLYEPVILKGLPVMPATRAGYARQRTLRHMEAFAEADAAAFRTMWYCE